MFSPDHEFRVIFNMIILCEYYRNHALHGTWGSEIVDDLKEFPDYIINKRHFDAFYDTDLDSLLRPGRGIPEAASQALRSQGISPGFS